MSTITVMVQNRYLETVCFVDGYLLESTREAPGRKPDEITTSDSDSGMLDFAVFNPTLHLFLGGLFRLIHQDTRGIDAGLLDSHSID